MDDVISHLHSRENMSVSLSVTRTELILMFWDFSLRSLVFVKWRRTKVRRENENRKDSVSVKILSLVISPKAVAGLNFCQLEGSCQLADKRNFVIELRSATKNPFDMRNEIIDRVKTTCGRSRAPWHRLQTIQTFWFSVLCFKLFHSEMKCRVLFLKVRKVKAN